MRPPIDDGVVMITGASSGIGKALAQRVAPRARVLILVARRLPRLETLAAELRAAHGRTVEPRSCDLADLAATERLMTARAMGPASWCSCTELTRPTLRCPASTSAPACWSPGSRPRPANACCTLSTM